MKTQLIIYTHKSKLIRLFKLTLIMIFHINTVFSQDYSNYYSDEYEDEKYDNYYDLNNKYKRAIEEEDLYNGGYKKRKQLNYDETPTSGLFGLGIDINNNNKKSWFETSNKNEITVPDKNYNRFGFDTREASLQEGNDIRSDSKNGQTNINDHDKSYKTVDRDRLTEDDRITEGAPPPPDTPDVPIESLLGKLLIIGAIITYIKIKAIYENGKNIC